MFVLLVRAIAGDSGIKRIEGAAAGVCRVLPLRVDAVVLRLQIGIQLTLASGKGIWCSHYSIIPVEGCYVLLFMSPERGIDKPSYRP